MRFLTVYPCDECVVPARAQRLLKDNIGIVRGLSFTPVCWYRTTTFPFSLLVLPILCVPALFVEKGSLTPLFGVRTHHPLLISDDRIVFAVVSGTGVQYLSMTAEGRLVTTSNTHVDREQAGSPIVGDHPQRYRQNVFASVKETLLLHRAKLSEVSGGKDLQKLDGFLSYQRFVDIENLCGRKTFLQVFYFQLAMVVVLPLAVFFGWRVLRWLLIDVGYVTVPIVALWVLMTIEANKLKGRLRKVAQADRRFTPRDISTLPPKAQAKIHAATQYDDLGFGQFNWRGDEILEAQKMNSFVGVALNESNQTLVSVSYSRNASVVRSFVNFIVRLTLRNENFEQKFISGVGNFASLETSIHKQNEVKLDTGDTLHRHLVFVPESFTVEQRYHEHMKRLEQLTEKLKVPAKIFESTESAWVWLEERDKRELETLRRLIEQFDEDEGKGSESV